MVNKSGLHPLGHAVLVEPFEPEVSKSVIAIPAPVKERESMLETRARVVEVGPAAWAEEQAPRAMPGDIVFITKHAGRIATGTKDGKLYRLVNDLDIFCRIEEGNHG